MREQYLYDHEMFKVNNGVYCGLLVPTHVMKKLMKIDTKWCTEIRQLLNEYKDELLVENWTMASDEEHKKASYVYYSETNEWDSVEHRIETFKPRQPEHVDVYLCDYDTAKKVAQEILEEEERK